MKLIFRRKKENLEFPKRIEILENEYSIEVHLIDKKNSSVNVRDDKLIFRISSRLSAKKINEHFEHLLDRISKQLSKRPSKKFISTKEILEKKEFTFANETYFIERDNKRSLRLKQNTFFVPEYLNDNKDIERKIIRQLYKKYEKRIKAYVRALNEQTYKFPIKEITLRNARSKWGHCTHRNDIMINLKLLNAPTEILDYVIIHELSHVKHKNHSAAFWSEVSKFCPNHKNLRKYLKNNPPGLYN